MVKAKNEDATISSKSKTITCIKCGKELTDGFYNTPVGPHCCDCWENKTSATAKEEVLFDSLLKINFTELHKKYKS